jgi:tetratricopeptide (TPR) repeat protein
MATVLDARLRELGWGAQRFRREFAEAGRALGYPHATIGEKQLRRWRTGAVRSQPQPEARDILAAMFGLPADRLLASAADHGPAEADDVYRREVLRAALAGAALGAAAPAIAALDAMRREMDRTLETTHVSTATLERWDRAADDYAAAYQVTPPALLLADIANDFRDVQRLLQEPQQVRVRVGLCRAASRLAVLAGVCLSALGLDREARSWLHTAELAAVETEDVTLIGQAVARSAIVVLYYGAPAGALADATRAQQLLGRLPSPALVRALMVQGRAHARLGHVDQALAALERAGDVHRALPSAATADTAFGYTERQCRWHLANGLTTLGLVEQAEPLQAQALAAYRPTEMLDPALIRLDQAAAIAHQGDPAEAADAAAAVWFALPADHQTGMVQRYVLDLIGRMPAAAVDLPAVRSLRELVAAEAAT